MTGTITKVVAVKGFGFIARPGESKDTFFHFTDLDGTLRFGEALLERRVEFDMIDTARGPKAVNVRAAD